MYTLYTILYVYTEQLAKRLRDADVDVRLGALSRLIDLGIESPDVVSGSTFEEIGQRVKDKKLEVRRVALTGMARLYYRHISSTLPSIDSLYIRNDDNSRSGGGSSSQESDHGGELGVVGGTTGSSSSSRNDETDDSQQLGIFSSILRRDVVQKLRFIPGYIVNAYGYPEMHHQIIQLLQELIIPKAAITTSTSMTTTGDDDSDNQHPVLTTTTMSQIIENGGGGGVGEVSQVSGRPSIVVSSKNDTKTNEDLDSRRSTAILLLFTLLTPTDQTFLGTVLGQKTKVRKEGV